jgi:hypothetical protein
MNHKGAIKVVVEPSKKEEWMKTEYDHQARLNDQTISGHRER